MGFVHGSYTFSCLSAIPTSCALPIYECTYYDDLSVYTHNITYVTCVYCILYITGEWDVRTVLLHNKVYLSIQMPSMNEITA